MSAAAADDKQTPQPPANFDVEVTDGLLSVDVIRAPVDEVMAAIARQSGVSWSSSGELGYISAQSFANEPLAQGIRRLLPADNGVLIEFAAESAREGFYNRLLREPQAAKVVYGEPKIVAIKVIGTRKLNLASDPAPISSPLKDGPPLSALSWDYNKEPKLLPPAGSRIGTVKRVVRTHGSVAIDPLITVLAFDPDAAVRAAVVQALAGFADDDAWNAINSALTDNDPRVRIKALEVQKTDNKGETPVALIGNFLQNDPSPKVRFAAVNLLAGYKDSAEAQEALQQALNDADENVRTVARLALQR